MRFMLLMIPKGYETAAPDATPPAEHVAEMMAYNKAMQDAGILIDLNGLHPPSRGARVSFTGRKARVVDGPFAETKEVLGGYWIIDVASRDEAIAWATRCPGNDDETIEVRQIQAAEDFPADVQAELEGFEAMGSGAARRKP